ncbi:MAG TPA: hypothetical protein DEB09_05260 [Candidatus Magasanikbacteria bacterium]|nr:hypothetical protein [Candidatus Magasanikbacteria bacterium]
MSLSVTKNCPDCGSAPTSHWSERMEARISYYVFPFFNIFNTWGHFFGRILSPLTRRIFPYLIKLLVVLKVIQIKNEPDESNNWRSKVLWEEANKRGIKITELRPFGKYVDNFWAEYRGEKIFFDGLPRPKNKVYSSLDWIDNKTEMAKRFLAQGFPVAKGGIVTNFRQAKKLFQKLSKPVITKPNEGSRSRHTTIHITNEDELRIGFDKVKQLSPWVAIQEELVGPVYRATVINKKLVAILRRDPACVYGDGISNIKELVMKENNNPLRHGPLFHELVLDSEATVELGYQNLSVDSIPGLEQRVTLGTKTSRGSGGSIVDVTDVTHEDNKKLFNAVGKYLDYPYVGIDFIISDIKKSWVLTPRSGIIECNSLPFIDLHHFPLQGKPINVAGAIWDFIYPVSPGKLFTDVK